MAAARCNGVRLSPELRILHGATTESGSAWLATELPPGASRKAGLLLFNELFSKLNILTSLLCVLAQLPRQQQCLVRSMQAEILLFGVCDVY